MTRAGTTLWIVGGSAVAVAAALLLGVGAGSEPPPVVPDPALETRLAQLGQRLEAEIEAREALEAEVADLELALALLGPLAAPDDEAGAEGELGLDPAASGQPSRRGVLQQLGRRFGEGPTFDEEDLVAAGLPADDARWLHDRYDESRLAQLNLRHAAEREEWERAALADELQAQNAALREDLGEDMYDWMLYGSGRPNRVRVREVLAGSAGAAMGIEPGDLILSYAGVPVYSPRDLHNLSTEPPLGQSVPIVIDRNGRRIEGEVQGGPIGVALGRARKAPEP